MVWVVSLSAQALSSLGLTPKYMSKYSEFVRVWQAVKPPSPIGSSTSLTKILRLFLKTFRGVRAISQFDQPFTPTHKSSRSFSTLIGSDLHLMLLRLHPAHGQITKVSRLPLPTIALLGLAFAAAFDIKSLTLPVRCNSQAHYAKGTPSPVGFD